MNTAIIGAQWGDEGKGKIVDMLAEKHGIVVRYNGGPNAGHTVVVGDDTLVLHQIPSGVLQGKKCVIGNGCVVNLDRLDEELGELSKRGVSVDLAVSERAHIITPYQLLLDVVKEISRGRQGKRIGTTFQGIGTAYEAKSARDGMRVVELVESSNSELESRLHAFCDASRGLMSALNVSGEDVVAAMSKDDSAVRMSRGLRTYFEKEMDFGKVLEVLKGHRTALGGFVQDISVLLAKASEEQDILFEGAQGTLLDVDLGTYPYCTSSNATIGGVYTGTGFGGRVDKRIGVLKAYTTRVGEGAFPTELKDETGENIRKKGGEFGATTGRPRRVGWEDLVIGRHAVRVNGLTQIAVTKLDVLDELDEISVCTRYDIDSFKTEHFPASASRLARAVPFYEVLDGWKADTSKARTFDELPSNAQKYISFIEAALGVRARYISVGPKRDQVIVR